MAFQKLYQLHAAPAQAQVATYLAFAKNFMADYFKMRVSKIFPRSLGSYVVTVLLEMCCDTNYEKRDCQDFGLGTIHGWQPRLRLMNGFKSNVIILVSTYIARSIFFCHISNLIRKVTNTFFPSPINVDVSSGA